MTDLPAPAQSVRLRDAVERLWTIMADDYGLLPELALDAIMARADRGELAAATPRLLQLTVGHHLAVADAAAVVGKLGAEPWPDGDRWSALVEVLDAWWLETLRREPGEHPPAYRPEVVLGVVVGLGAPMVRWLGPWLDELDGPGAAHLAATVLGGHDGLSGPAWAGKDDQARQVFGWARTEPVVTGLTLVGGVHLHHGVLGDVLDRLIG